MQVLAHLRKYLRTYSLLRKYLCTYTLAQVGYLRTCAQFAQKFAHLCKYLNTYASTFTLTHFRKYLHKYLCTCTNTYASRLSVHFCKPLAQVLEHLRIFPSTCASTFTFVQVFLHLRTCTSTHASTCTLTHALRQPRKHIYLSLCWLNAMSLSATLAQHINNIGSTFCVFRAEICSRTHHLKPEPSRGCLPQLWCV